jgi:hypothetical protein
MRISIGRAIVVENVDTGVFGINAVRVGGEATDQQPARLVLLHRHADMADEKTVDDARSEIERGADNLASALASVDTRVAASDLSMVIEKAQNALKDTETYYSVLVAMVRGRSVFAAGIGNMNMHLWEIDAVRPILSATMSLVGSTRIMSSALGLGFAPERIQKAWLSLNAGDRIIMGVNADLSSLQPAGHSESANEVVHRALQSADVRRSAVFGVITRPESAPRF